MLAEKDICEGAKLTPFGKLPPCADGMILEKLLRDGDKIIGYISGPTLLNAIGLCSWIPKECHITTNNYRYQLPANTHIRIYTPVVAINNDNAPYLQMIDAITAMEQYPVDAEKPNEILRGILWSGNLSNERLIFYARKHYGQEILLKISDIT